MFKHIFIFLLSFSAHNIVFSQEILWQKGIGGDRDEYLYTMKSTPDFGFILAGSSFSSSTGNKKDASKGDLDYFLWKMNENGDLEWQKSFGGEGSDFLYSIELLEDGGYLLGGSSNSSISGDKTSSSLGGLDFWVVRLDPLGNIIWQETYGGAGDDNLMIVKKMHDGYLLGGNSNSSPIKDKKGHLIGQKKNESLGSVDLWLVKISFSGEIIWEKTIGGQFVDEIKSIELDGDKIIIGASSNSPISGNKMSQNIGQLDFWLLVLNNQGEILWEETYGGDQDDILSRVLVDEEGYYLLGNSSSSLSETKKSNTLAGSDFWLVKIDKLGNYLWDQTFDFGHFDNLVSASFTTNGDIILGGFTNKLDKEGRHESDFISVKINSKGDLLWSKVIGGNMKDELKSVVETRDGAIVMAGNSNSKKSRDKDQINFGGLDFWVVKLQDTNKQNELDRKLVEIYPNPTDRFTNILIQKQFESASLQVFDLSGRILKEEKLKYQANPIDLQGLPSGVYVFNLMVDQDRVEFKVVKK